MENRREGTLPRLARASGRGTLLALTFLFMLVAVAISTGLVVHAAWRHDLENGLFAIAFSVLSTRGGRKPVDEALQ